MPTGLSYQSLFYLNLAFPKFKVLVCCFSLGIIVVVYAFGAITVLCICNDALVFYSFGVPLYNFSGFNSLFGYMPLL